MAMRWSATVSISPSYDRNTICPDFKKGSRQLRGFVAEDFCNPIRVWKTGFTKAVEFSLHIVFHTPNGWFLVVQQQVRGACISVVGQAHTARIDDEHGLNGSDKRAVNVAINDNGPLERPVDRLQLLLTCFRPRRTPGTFRTRVDQGY